MSAIVQTVIPATTTGSSLTFSPMLTQTNSLLILSIAITPIADALSSITDNAGNTYSIAASNGGGTVDLEMRFCAASNPTSSITVNFSGAIDTKSVIFREYSGVLANKSGVVWSGQTASGTGTAVTTTSSVTSDSPCLAICQASCAGTTPTLAVGSGYGNFTSQTLVSGVSLQALEDQVIAPNTTIFGTMTAGGTLPVWNVSFETFVLGAPNNFAKHLRPHPFSPGIAR